MANSDFRALLNRGVAIPAHPLALDSQRRLDERHQRALTRYYLAAGVGGLAVGVHTTQFAIREPSIGLLEPVLALAAEEMRRSPQPLVDIAGICGLTHQAVAEAGLATSLGYDAGLLSLSAWRAADEASLIDHCRAVADVIPIVGFYLQPSVGGRVLSYSFWRRFVEIDAVVAIKIAPFNRYQTLDVVRAVIAAGRDDIALYTGNDDNIVSDLITPFEFNGRQRRIVGGLLGQWSVGTRRAVELLERCQREPASPDLLRLGVELTDFNAACFDAANGFQGCIAGMHEVLRRQGLLLGNWCLDEHELLGPGQLAEIERVLRTYPHLNDDQFVAEQIDDWLRP
ncbi:MAG: dihydrodipicolinate synthase family protein [Planctomycetia bacterium]|nr:dihydrodipicolinate synthase family protein [Planctomycetia bacterium]